MLNLLARWLMPCARALGPYRMYRILNACYGVDAKTLSDLLNYWLAHELPARPVSDEILMKYLDADQLIRALQHQCDRQDSPFYAFHVFAEIDRICRRHGCAPARVLEIGPGSSVGAAACFLAGGAESATAVDIEPLKKDRQELYRQMGEYLSCVGGFRWWRNYAVHPEDRRAQYASRWRPEEFLTFAAKVRYHAPVPAERLPFADSSFDLSYSIAVLEHVADPQTSLREIARVTTPGGYAVHEIDLRHHGSSDFIQFLSLDEGDWRARTQRYGNGRALDGILDGSWKGEAYCNRLRMSDWLTAFSQAGLAVLECEKLCVLEERATDRARLSAEFRDRTGEDLTTLLIRVTARKESDS